MSEIHLTVSAEEKDLLLRMLRGALTSKQIEIHRTDSLAYRRDLEHEAELLETLVARFQVREPSLS